MDDMPTLFWISILFCLVLGAAIETSDACLCRASANLTTGKPAMAIGLLFVTAVASVVFYVSSAFDWHRQPLAWSMPTGLTVLGAAMFALGTVLNDACTVGTIGRLARGDVGHLATFAGALTVAWLLPRHPVAAVSADPPPMHGLPWLGIVLACVAAFMILGRRHLPSMRLGSYLLIGLMGAIISDWEGNATWLGVFQNLQGSLHLAPLAFAGIAAIVAGAAVTAIIRRLFRFVRPDPLTMLREFAGGGLMVGGTILIPGGNFTLSVYGVPSGDLNAVTGYVLMFAFILLMLRAKQAWAGRPLPALKRV
jgi:hypothetical protein